MKIAAHIADFLGSVSPRVYGVTGAGAMHLNDAIAHHPGIRFLPMHHEQAAAFAAEADARVSGKPGIVMVTAGPGGTNALTAVAAAFVDSIPMLVIGGQAHSATLKHAHLRQLGMNELPVAAVMAPVTKWSATVTNPATVDGHLNEALHLAISGRPGPVFLDFPLDVQGADMPTQVPWSPPERPYGHYGYICGEVLKLLRDAERPVLVIGHGVRLAGALDEIRAIADRLHVPIVTSWGAIDILPDHACVIGRMGIFGDRAGNLTVQSADLLLCIGTRLSIPQIGHAVHLFAPQAKRIIVDVDPHEAAKAHLHADLAIEADAKAFLTDLLGLTTHLSLLSAHRSEWLTRCRDWRRHYPVRPGEYREGDGVNSYFLAEQIAAHAADDAIIVTDVGFAYLTLMQGLRLKPGQRLFHSGGVSAMGCGIPAAIGACMAGNGRSVICITGDGGAMMNLQELQTIAHHQLSITIFVLANDGYKTIRMMQENHFGRYAGAGPESGLSCPDFSRIAAAFDIGNAAIYSNKELADWMHFFAGRKHPLLVELHMDRAQVIAPRVQSRLDGNTFVPAVLDDMWPYLERGEQAANARGMGALAVLDG